MLLCRYNYACTFVQNNPDVMLAPAPNSKVIPKYSAGAGNNVSTISTLPGTLAGQTQLPLLLIHLPHETLDWTVIRL